jgi:prepilin-type processing-associated H-X9-DG protein
MGRPLTGGLGLLFIGGYCEAAQCFYCPSHRGEHPVERYLEMWSRPGGQPIYSNYHYAGHRHWDTGFARTWRNADRLVIATDGLRTASDFNHGNGMNVLYGDASVRWNSAAAAILPLLPLDAKESGPPEDYFAIWDNIQTSPLAFE